ncbi:MULTISPECIES: alanine racemase [unclassified Mesorhizobium]|uniref:alanine racemase n=2 Tax=Mesorhizobium TaxID=68287 RepID=UPI000F74E0D4|nr:MULTISPECIES: alanine racemase [unclassified Mesorhizobium]AZO02484.1 YhfX family PLP-dependent enzyme [Mesorhizobium sp. M2A.F.Ca.ET.043.02.1.1]RUW38585.1 YhfX family PLP-dependent enzyme [Mesorhizobium sp. M2A.F.Ca.ET.015.02.1.1]RVC91737.1 YhfX family PLP-dependent enzyme [Mesorhizobium sp. M2A.F.Ca.ET.017.03.2.1]RVD07744.1 YhfX family PLP-dependent enzyme [Mesorhizobium sp. M2A.F.Ca.ET.029.05.1.1]RWB46313.1 MAG: YhfX family PLP-dependent enzyme [Mesorhizobium sp.]
MFLDVLRRRNPALIEAAIGLHQQGKLPANAYVLDLDTVERNAKVLKQEADRLGLKIFAMTKQVGRSSSFCKAVMRGGIERAVAVDMACARATHKAGMKLGHLGHLQQIAKFEADAAARTFKPDYWTVFNDTKAEEAGKGAKAAGYVQDLLARIAAEGDIFYRGHEGGFDAGEIVAVADRLDAVPGGRFAGITTFPALLFNHAARKVLPTPNLATLSKAAEALAKAGRKGVEINAPGTTSSVMLAALAEAGATQCEPGNGLHGATALHVMEDLPELPAVLYLTEVSHLSGGKAYCFGGGFYIDPIFPDYDVKAIVSAEPTTAASALRSVEVPPPSAIDYYAMIDAAGANAPRPGDSAVFGFRGQAFVTRAYVVGVSGVSKGKPVVETIENGFGEPYAWPV